MERMEGPGDPGPRKYGAPTGRAYRHMACGRRFTPGAARKRDTRYSSSAQPPRRGSSYVKSWRRIKVVVGEEVAGAAG